MLRHSGFALLLAGALLCAATASFAWDGTRKGFVLGLGAGGGLASFKTTTRSFEGERQNDFALMTDFKAGFAPNQQLAIFWMSKVSWFGRDYTIITGPFSSEKVSFTVANGVGGLGMSYYFRPEGSSPYVTGGLGFSSWGTPFEEGSEALYGFGFVLGAGYEFAKHWSLEANLALGRPDNEDFNYGINTLAARVTINVLGY